MLAVLVVLFSNLLPQKKNTFDLSQGWYCGVCDINNFFFLFLAAIYIICGILHPHEFIVLPCGVVYFCMMPSMFIFMNIYAFMGMDNMSWGTRESMESGKAGARNTAQSKPVKKRVYECRCESWYEWFLCKPTECCRCIDYEQEPESDSESKDEVEKIEISGVHIITKTPNSSMGDSHLENSQEQIDDDKKHDNYEAHIYRGPENDPDNKITSYGCTLKNFYLNLFEYFNFGLFES